jgi:predicted transcriptional regulator
MVAATQPVAVKLDGDTRARIKHLADTRSRSMHWIMREAIRQYVDREEKREAFRLDAVVGLIDYELSGIHVTQEEADYWLGVLEAGRDVEQTKWHA